MNMMILGDVVSIRNGFNVQSFIYNRDSGECGTGAFSNVYRGYIAGTDTIVAIKEFKDEANNTEEIANLRKLSSHNNIISLLHWGFSWTGVFCLVTDFCQTTLDKAMTDAQQQVLSQINSIVIQLADALRYMKKNSVVHLDLKPSNLLIANERLIKVCDFGSSRTVTKKMAVIKPAGGTPHYMSPEVLKEDPGNTTNPYQCDIWAFGKD